MLRQIEWGVQNGPITENRICPVTTLFIYLLFFVVSESFTKI